MANSVMNESSDCPTVVGLGEGLFDVIAGEAHCGGAPLNFAVHAHQLDNRGCVVTRIGRDALGDRLRGELAARGMPVAYLQIDPVRPTGTVQVEFDAGGEPRYEIVAGVAWDALQYTAELHELAGACDAVCFGTLAQRASKSRETIYKFLEAACQAERLLDVNLRQEYYDMALLERSCELATSVKLNEDELRELSVVFALPADIDGAAAALRDRFRLRWLALTRGPRGTIVYDETGWHETEPVAAEGTGGDAVGAGDAAAAALVHGAIRRWPWSRTLALANRLGAYVASQRGACPRLDASLEKMSR